MYRERLKGLIRQAAEAALPLEAGAVQVRCVVVVGVGGVGRLAGWVWMRRVWTDGRSRLCPFYFIHVYICRVANAYTHTHTHTLCFPCAG